MSRVYVLVLTAAFLLLALQVMLRFGEARWPFVFDIMVTLLHRLCFCRLGVIT